MLDLAACKNFEIGVPIVQSKRRHEGHPIEFKCSTMESEEAEAICRRRDQNAAALAEVALASGVPRPGSRQMSSADAAAVRIQSVYRGHADRSKKYTGELLAHFEVGRLPDEGFLLLELSVNTPRHALHLSGRRG
jgi:hypothetical protein